MYLDSVIVVLSSTPDLCTRSDPDKSTKCSFDTRFTSDPSRWDSNQMTKMQCDLVEASFFGVSETTRFVSPMNSKFRASSSV